MINRKYEDAIFECAGQQPDNPFSWIAANGLSRDILMKNYYMNEMANCVKRSDKVFDYLKGIFYTHSIGKVELKRELSSELVKKHPVSGRLSLILFLMY